MWAFAAEFFSGCRSPKDAISGRVTGRMADPGSTILNIRAAWHAPVSVNYYYLCSKLRVWAIISLSSTSTPTPRGLQTIKRAEEKRNRKKKKLLTRSAYHSSPQSLISHIFGPLFARFPRACLCTLHTFTYMPCRIIARGPWRLMYRLHSPQKLHVCTCNL